MASTSSTREKGSDIKIPPQHADELSAYRLHISPTISWETGYSQTEYVSWPSRCSACRQRCPSWSGSACPPGPGRTRSARSAAPAPPADSRR
uniref:Uncharacterized protein n=1 Tax=Zea mays TaxID=4577 RepID=C4IZ97_MAIZE|nr:unknown [Zea mays]ACR37167.1 unknown [Zea mays]